MTALCESCIHFCESHITTELKREYECRANPPTVAFIPTPQGVVKWVGYPTIQKVTPACGIYEPVGKNVHPFTKK